MSAARTLCLDFDDTLCDAREAPLAGAREALLRLGEAGWQLALCSARFEPLFGELVPRRIAQVEAWLVAHRFPPIHVTATLPAAEVYVDDKGATLSGNWEQDMARVLALAGAAWRGRRGRVTLRLDDVWDLEGGLPQDGAPGALARIAAAGCELVLSTPEDLPPRPVLEALRSHGFPRLRLSPHKLSSAVYASRRGLRFEGDWGAVERSLLALP